MERLDLLKITLETPVYHPLFGTGSIRVITRSKITVSFQDQSVIDFSISGIVGQDHFLKDIYLKPVKIVLDE